MKKLMTIAAAALCAAAVQGQDGITSTAIVGYAQGALRNGGTHMTAQFQPIGSEGFTLADLQPNSYNVTLYSVDNFGRPLTFYAWTNEGGPDWDVPNVWVDVDTNEIIDGKTVKFQTGDALFIQASSTDDAITTAGQVITKDVTVQLRNGGTLVGNPYPVTLKLVDILPNSYSVTLYAVDNFGRPLTMYSYTNEGGPDWDIPDVWVDLDTNEVIDDTVMIGPGEGLFIQASSTDDTITFPAPEL